MVSKAFRLFVEPWLDLIYYYLDLRHPPTPDSPKGHPNHDKVLSSIAFFFGLVGLAIFGESVVTTCAAVERLVFLMAKGALPVDAQAIGGLVKACALMTASLLAYGALVFGMAFSLSGFRTWAKTKGGGTTETLARAAEAVVNADIETRRRQGGGDFEVTE